MNDEIIKGLKSYYTYEATFNNLTEEEKEKYFIYSDSIYYITNYLKTKGDQFIIEFINKNDLNGISSFIIFEIIECLNCKNLLLNIIDSLPNSIIEHYRFEFLLKQLDDDLYKMAILNKLICRLENKNDIKKIVNLLEDDKNKIKYFNLLSKSDQVYLIKKFNDLDLKKEYVLKPEYSNYRSELVASVDDEQFIINIFEQNNVKKFRFNLISRIDNLALKEKLIYKLGNKSLIEFIESFNKEEKNVEIDNEIDSNITIGVELETCHKDIEVLKLLNEMPHGFKITKDGSVVSGFEIVSPILNHTQEDMNHLNDICTILKENSFYTDSSCGGHIHLGADYLKNIDEYKMFLHLYCNFEDIIYLICNKMNTKCRTSINRYAAKTKTEYLNAVKEGVFEDDYLSLEDFKQKLIELNDSRYKGLNVQNLKNFGKNTFEFRMANGEIEYNELYHNIKLYTRLLQVSKELANIKKDDPRIEYLNLLNTQLKEKEKLSILLGLLFKNEEDRKFYRNRYEKNINVVKDILNNIKKSKSIPIVNTKTLILN